MAVNTLDIQKSRRPDGITPIVLKKCASGLALLRLFRYSYRIYQFYEYAIGAPDLTTGN